MLLPPLWLPLGCRLNMFDRDVVMLRLFESPRRNGSYDELAAACGSVADDSCAVVVADGGPEPPAPNVFRPPCLAGLGARPSTAFLRTLISRNSRSIRSARPRSTSSSESSFTGSSASICCLRMRSSWWNDGVSEAVGMSGRSRIECVRGSGYQASRLIRPVRCRLTYRQLLVNVCSLPHSAVRKGPATASERTIWR